MKSYKKYLALLLCFILFISVSGCASDTERDDEKENRPKSSKSKKTDDKDSDFERLVICGIELSEDDYFFKRKSGTDYLMVEAGAFESAFKIPYIPEPYPYIDRLSDGKISITWNDQEGILLQVDMEEDSTIALINGKEYDVGMAPTLHNDALFIPSNLFISILEMEENYDMKRDTLFVDRNEDFPEEILIGNWSDIETNLFTGYKDITTGLVALPSYAEAYAFNEDGTYRLIIISTGGKKEGILHLEGKYVIRGNTIVCYDIIETLYEGNPLQLVHDKKRLKDPHYEYIYNYDPNEDKIQFTFWLNRLE